jgi:hypothetical protein
MGRLAPLREVAALEKCQECRQMAHLSNWLREWELPLTTQRSPPKDSSVCRAIKARIASTAPYADVCGRTEGRDPASSRTFTQQDQAN